MNCIFNRHTDKFQTSVSVLSAALVVRENFLVTLFLLGISVAQVDLFVKWWRKYVNF